MRTPVRPIKGQMLALRMDPAAPLLKWSLGTMFAITLAHERRHLWQARVVRNDRNFPVGAIERGSSVEQGR